MSMFKDYMKIILVLLFCISFSVNSEEHCLTEQQVKNQLEDGILSELFKPKYLLDEKIENLNFLNVIRGNLNSDNEMQSASISLIDKKNSLEFMKLKNSIHFGAIAEDELINVKKDLLFLIDEIEKEWERVPTTEDLTTIIIEFRDYLNITRE